MRVLVAEDNSVMAHVLQFNLKRAGFDVHVAADGRLAVSGYFPGELLDLLHRRRQAVTKIEEGAAGPFFKPT